MLLELRWRPRRWLQPLPTTQIGHQYPTAISRHDSKAREARRSFNDYRP